MSFFESISVKWTGMVPPLVLETSLALLMMLSRLLSALSHANSRSLESLTDNSVLLGKTCKSSDVGLVVGVVVVVVVACVRVSSSVWY